MTEINISWSTWKLIKAANPAWARYHVVRGDGKTVATGHDRMQFMCSVMGSDHDEWTADHASGSTSLASREDAVAMLIGLSTPGTSYDGRGTPVVAPTFMHTSEQARIRGYVMTAEPGETVILDIEATTQILVQGGTFWAQNTKIGDKAHFSVVDKNDVLGLHTANNIPLGTPIELVRYVENFLFPEREFFQDSILMPTVAPITQGLFMRATMECVAGGVDRDMAVTYRWYIGAN